MSLSKLHLKRAKTKIIGGFLPVLLVLPVLFAATARAQITDPVPGVVPFGDIILVLEEFSQVPASSGSFPKTRIVHLKPAGDRSGRLFVNDLNGKMHLVSQGSASLYLDLGAQTPAFKSSPGLGTGFTSFSFHPQFASNGKLYTSHTENPGSGTPDFELPNTSDSVALQGVITEWTATDPTANAFSGTKREILRVDISGTIHGLQEIEFNLSAVPGSDDFGMLYICIGDGGSTIGGNPENTSRLDSHQGTIFRIDPTGNNSGNGEYGVPTDNPWASDNDADTYGEIWAYGFRNPHRITWDTGGDNIMLEGDIGERNIEEINLIEPGNHYGWNAREGTFVINPEFTNRPENGAREEVFQLPVDDASFGFTYPVAQYDRDEGRAIAGGYVYRGTLAPEMVGKYLFGDITDGELYFVDVGELSLGTQVPIEKMKVKLDGNLTSMLTIIGRSRADIRFGYDESNELYITEKQNGKIYKIVGAEVPEPPPVVDAVFSNVSTRGSIDGTVTPASILTPGIVIEGTDPKTVLIRAIGPGLGQFGVTNFCPDPVLDLFDQADTSTPMASNAKWGDAANAADIATTAMAVGGFAIPDDSLDAALLMTLNPGAYTAQASCNGGAGDVLTETYAVD